MNRMEKLVYKRVEDVLEGKITEERARHIFAGSGYLALFDYELKQFREIWEEKDK